MTDPEGAASAATAESRLKDLLAGVGPLEPLDVTLGDARGCLLAEDIVSPLPMPPFSICTGSGYAVRASEARGTVELRVVDDVPAGYLATAAVQEGTAIKVAAGAPLPPGADAIADMDQVAVLDDVVTVTGPVQTGKNIAAEGSVAPRDKILVPVGTRVDSRVVGVLAAIGRSRVSVRPRPRVVVVSVGGELRAAGSDMTGGLIFDATGLMLASAASEAGAVPYRVGPIGDERRLIADTLDDQLVRADLLVVCGGTAGPDDSVRAYLERLPSITFDAESTNLGVFGHGKLGDDDIPVVALPGDPASAFMLFAALVRPMINAMLGRDAERPRTVTMTAATGSHLGAIGLRLAKSEGGGRATPLPGDAPTVLDLLAADLLIRIGSGQGDIAAGSAVTAVPLEPNPTRPA